MSGTRLESTRGLVRVERRKERPYSKECRRRVTYSCVKNSGHSVQWRRDLERGSVLVSGEETRGYYETHRRLDMVTHGADPVTYTSRQRGQVHI